MGRRRQLGCRRHPWDCCWAVPGISPVSQLFFACSKVPTGTNKHKYQACVASCSCVHIQTDRAHTHLDHVPCVIGLHGRSSLLIQYIGNLVKWYIHYISCILIYRVCISWIGCRYIKMHDVYITCNMRHADIIRKQYTDGDVEYCVIYLASALHMSCKMQSDAPDMCWPTY